jgi:hypothetical protein
MKRNTFLSCCLLLLAACSSNNDVAVTQTGNPTQANLLIKADTATAAQPLFLAKQGIAGFIINKAWIVLKRVEMEPVDGDEVILFNGKNPYIIELIPGGKTGLIDSIQVIGGNTYESVEIEFEPVLSLDSTTEIPDELLKSNSVVVRGYMNGNPLDSFVFASDIEGSFEYALDSALVTQSAINADILIKVRVYEWFSDLTGGFLDPRAPANKEIIEENIQNSVSADGHEEEDEEETDDETDE